jgi:hypothetical protein
MRIELGGSPTEQNHLVEQLPREIIKGAEYMNYSGHPLEEILHHFQKEGQVSAFSKVIILPDFSPVRGPLPTGCCVELKSKVGWRDLVLSDIGCGIALARSSMDWDYFNSHLGLWDQVADRLKANKGNLGDLGSGNHFLDAVVDEDTRVYFAVHTGSRDQAARLKPMAYVSEDKFEEEYQQVSVWAQKNREKVIDFLKNIYGDLELVLDRRHNSYFKDLLTGGITVYKGAMRLEPGQSGVIPSSMEGEMLLVTGSDNLKTIDNAMCHGTGRVRSRSESRLDAPDYDIAALRRRIYIPDSISDSSVIPERPDGYRKMSEVRPFIEQFAHVQKVLTPVAYIGQL